jgi:hypothetical protein
MPKQRSGIGSDPPDARHPEKSRFKRVVEAGPLSQWLYSVLAENDLRATLRNFGLKVGMIGTVKFETRIRELVENLPDLVGRSVLSISFDRRCF